MNPIKTGKNKEQLWDKYKTNGYIVGLNSSSLIITLIVNGLKTLIKRQTMSDWIR